MNEQDPKEFDRIRQAKERATTATRRKYDEKLDGMVVSAAHIEPPIQTVLRFFDFPCREFYLPIVATIEASLLPSKCPQGTTTIPWHPGWGRPVSSLP